MQVTLLLFPCTRVDACVRYVCHTSHIYIYIYIYTCMYASNSFVVSMHACGCMR